MALIACGALAGSMLAIFLYALLQSWPGAGWVWSPLLLCLPCCWLKVMRPARRLLLATPAGWVLAAMTLTDYQSRLLAPDADFRALVQAEVVSLPVQRGGALEFDARLEPLKGPLPASIRATLDWTAAPAVRVGERWQLLLALRAPTQRVNPGNRMPWRAALMGRMHAEARVVPSRLNLRLHSAPASLDGLRAGIASRLLQRVDDRDAAALVLALAIGETALLSQDQWRVFSATGISHLVAISGLHVTLFSLLAGGLARRAWRWVPPLQARWPREHCAAAIGVAAAAGYALLAGFSIPTQRTLVMLTLWHLLRSLARPVSASGTLGVAALIVLLLDPLAPLDAGFWLSFVAVALLLYGAAPAGTAPAWRTLLRTQWLVTAGLLPVTAALFGSVSIAGLLVNLLAIPVFSLLLVPLILTSVALLAVWPWASGVLLATFQWLHGMGWPLLHATAGNDMAVWTLLPGWWLLPAFVGLFWALLAWPVPMRLSSLGALLLAAWPASATLRDGQFSLLMLDAGRALGVIVRTRTHALLFDNAESWGSNGGAARAIVLPALRALDIRRLDAVLMPRLDAHRSAGLVSLAARVPVHRRLLGSAGDALPPEFEPCTAGMRWSWNGVQFEVLEAARCTLRIRGADGFTALLPADLDAEGQRALALSMTLRADATLIPRSGSAAASAAALRAAVQPRWALLAQTPTGAATRTVRDTVAAWESAGAAVLVTGRCGAIELMAGRSDARICSWRAPSRCGDKALFNCQGFGIMPGGSQQPE